MPQAFEGNMDPLSWADRVKLVRIDPRDILAFLQDWKTASYLNTAVLNGVPPGTRVLSVHAAHEPRCFELIVHHPSFDPVPPGMVPPYLAGPDGLCVRMEAVRLRRLEDEPVCQDGTGPKVAAFEVPASAEVLIADLQAALAAAVQCLFARIRGDKKHVLHAIAPESVAEWNRLLGWALPVPSAPILDTEDPEPTMTTEA